MTDDAEYLSNDAR